MTRRLLNLLTVLSLLLCLLSIGLSVTAFRRTDAIKYSDGETSWVIANARAGLLAWSYGDGMSKDWPGWYGWRGEPGDTVMGTVHPPAGRFGFAFQCYHWKADSASVHGWILAPHWSLAMPGTILVAWRLRRARSSRSPSGQCAACGYDLTGNVSGVCPECGAVAQQSISASTTSVRKGST
jgi:hypothetical protein